MINQLRVKSAGISSGVAFIGGIKSNFQLIIRMPIYDYTVLKRYLSNCSYLPECVWYSGSLSVSDLVLPQYCGTFILTLPTGKVRKFKAAFVYPLDLNYKVTPSEYSMVQEIIVFLSQNKCKYYDKKDYSLEALFKRFPPISAIYSNLIV